MTVTVGMGGVSKVGSPGGAAPELGMSRADPGIDDIGGHSRAILGIGIGAIQRQVALIDPIQAPGGWIPMPLT